MLAEQKLAAHSGGGRTHRGDPGRAEETCAGLTEPVIVSSSACRRARAGAAPGLAAGAAARNSHITAAAPARPPMTTGVTSATWLAGLVIVTNAANRVNAATPATPAAASRRASVPITMATTATVTYMPSSSTVRPCAPNWCTTALRRRGRRPVGEHRGHRADRRDRRLEHRRGQGGDAEHDGRWARSFGDRADHRPRAATPPACAPASARQRSG